MLREQERPFRSIRPSPNSNFYLDQAALTQRSAQTDDDSYAAGVAERRARAPRVVSGVPQRTRRTSVQVNSMILAFELVMLTGEGDLPRPPIL